jgi:tetratricopeptide (TPR) repeat protein
MDRLDRFTIIALAVLLIGAVTVGYQFEKDQLRKGLDRTKQLAAATQAGTNDPRMKIARELLHSGNIPKAEMLLNELLQGYPYEAELYMLLGDVKMGKLDSIGALAFYQEAIDLNPDYLDKKTPSFQGKKIKVAVEEARTEIERHLRSSPGDEQLGKAKKTMYYLLRRLAGSCG